MENYEVKIPEIEALLKDIGRKLKTMMPKGWGFSFLMFSIGEKGSTFYISDCNREDVINAMKEFIEKNK